MDHLLYTKNVSKAYNNIPVVKNLNLYLSKEEFLGVLGKNGSGKSTIVKIISGAIQADSGEIFINGQKVNIRNPIEAKKLGISVVYQELNLFEELSVAENIFLGEYPSLLNSLFNSLGFIDLKDIYKKAKMLCEKYNYEIDVKRKVKHLGMGEKKIVEIIKALSQNANILIMDEPSTALSEKDVQKLFNILRRIKSEGISVIYITHNVDDIYLIADRVVVIDDGEINKNEKVINSQANDLIRSMAGKEIKERYPKLNVKKSSELLRVDKLNREGILTDISFSLYNGEILGLTGLIGSGRSSVARAIFGVDKRNSGDIYIKGKKAGIKSPKDAVMQGISYIPEDRVKSGVISGESIARNITIAHLQGVENEKIRWMVSEAYEKKRVEVYSKRLAIKRNSINQKVEQLSGGNQQKVLIARWLFADANIFLFDEPTKGIDIATKVEVYNIMNELVREEKGILLISSDLSELLGMCDRILVMYKGSIVKEIMRNEASKELILSYASGFMSL